MLGAISTECKSAAINSGDNAFTVADSDATR